MGAAIVLAGLWFGFHASAAESANVALESLAYLLIGGCLIADPNYFLAKLALDDGLATYESAVPTPYLSTIAVICLLISYLV